MYQTALGTSYLQAIAELFIVKKMNLEEKMSISQ